MKIAVIGANGQLGSDICDCFIAENYEIIKINHDNFEVSNSDIVNSTLAKIVPDLVINTSAMHNVDACESDPLKSYEVNAVGARNLARTSNEVGFTLVHLSTDYVFDGEKKAPYLETDCPNPLNVYGNTKLAGELFIKNIAKKYFILRVSGLYGKNPCRAKGGNNFVTLMLKLARERDEVRVVDDEILTPTFTGYIARQINQMVPCTDYGVYHVTSQRSCSWYEFAKKIFELTGVTTRLSKALPGEFPIKVPRPKYSVLENNALQKIGLDTMPDWEEGLKKYLVSLGYEI